MFVCDALGRDDVLVGYLACESPARGFRLSLTLRAPAFCVGQLLESVGIGHRDTVRFRKIVCRPSNAVSRIIQRGDAVALAHPLSIQWRQRWWLRWLDRGDDSAPDTHDVVAVVTAQKDLRHVATALRTVDFHAVLFRFTENGGAPQRDSHGLGGHVSCRKRCLVLNTQICGHGRVTQADACRPLCHRRHDLRVIRRRLAVFEQQRAANRVPLAPFSVRRVCRSQYGAPAHYLDRTAGPTADTVSFECRD
jgi:hypothetical protein